MTELAARAEHWALTLTRIPSVTGTPDEVAFAETLCGLLRASPAFRDRPDDVWTIPTSDRLGRASVAALLRGRGRRTVVLTGHFDTVTVADYGDLQPLATEPEQLKDALLARLRRDARSEAEQRALADLSGPDFLPGRGLLDMKGGLAAGLAVLEAAAAEPEREGNLLFLAVPDEEVNSSGARSAARALPGVAERLGLSLDAAINLDCLGDTGDGRFGRSVALGSVGKLLPSALVVGRAAHAAETIHGVSAAALAGAIAAAVEWAPELTESLGNASGTPATLLGMKDGKAGYDVTTPGTVWMFWNTARYRRGPEDVLAPLARLIEDAAAGVAAQLRQRGGADVPDVPVLRFAELRREVLARSPEAGAALATAAAQAAEAGLDLPEQCRRITEALWRLSGRSGPAVVLGLASMPYLPVSLGGDEAGQRLERATREAAAKVAARHGTTIGLEPWFPGISDMSFLGMGDESSVAAIAADTPAWGAGLPWPDGPALAQIPIVNAGPWGRDYHTPLERIYRPYAFEVLPELIREIADGVIRG
jgi:arginine utilization protein RocB